MKFLQILSDAYYKGEPLVSNEYFDELARKFNYTGLGTDSEQEIEHTYRMFSLDKVYPGENLPFEGGIGSPKLDGAAVEITYNEGSLIWAATRGNGLRGLDITEKMRTFVPTTISHRGFTQISGEVVTLRTTPNARNYASGALNLKSVEEFKKRELWFFAYDMQPFAYNYYTDNMDYLQGLGFMTVIGSVLDDFPTDGSVVRLNSNEEYRKAGFTTKHPRGAYALKENKDSVPTILLDIQWAVGRSGVVSPVAILEPVEVDGAMVSRATLHNWKYIQKLELEKNCKVGIIRAGEIIPRVVERIY